MARIGIDGTFLAIEGKGVARYLFEYLWALNEIPSQHDYFIFLDSRAALPALPQHPHFHYVEMRIFSSLVWEQFLLPKAIRKFKLQLFHTPLDRLPIFSGVPFMMYLFETPEFRNKMLQSVERSSYSQLSRRLIQTLFPRSLKKAARILVSSQSTWKDLEENYEVPSEKLRLVYPAANMEFHPANPEEKKEIRSQFGLLQGYLLHFSSDDPRDNTLTVLEAYAKVRQLLKEAPPLLIGGKINHLLECYLQAISRMNISEHVRFVGFKSGKNLIQLYQGASVYFDPSLFEGFGFQVAEAMACGVPIVASNVSSLPELVGDAALMANPTDVETFSIALVRVLSDANLAQQMSEKSLRESKKFSWKKHAEETAKIYAELLGTVPFGDSPHKGKN